jgi:hypothetical protein
MPRAYHIGFLIKIMVYVAGFIWAEIKQLYQEGLHQYMVIEFLWLSNFYHIQFYTRRIPGIY